MVLPSPFLVRIAAQQGFQLDAGGEVVTKSNTSGKHLCCECPARTALRELFVQRAVQKYKIFYVSLFCKEYGMGRGVIHTRVRHHLL